MFRHGADAHGRVLNTGEDRPGIGVPLVTLDAVVSGGVSALKIDVEGFEMEVLAGAERILADPQLMIVVIEINDSGHLYGHTDREVRTALLDAGFVEAAYDPRERDLRAGMPAERAENSIFVRDVGHVAALVAAAPVLTAGPWRL